MQPPNSKKIKFLTFAFSTLGIIMFCSKCGEKLPEEAYFCHKCGARTSKGIEAGVSAAREDLKEAFAKMGEEMEKAFSVAAKEIKKAFKTAREEIKGAINRESVVCSHCGKENFADARFCYKCGKKLD
jgi:ribosomal protein L40E